MIVFFDIDGTLADCRHRRHFVTNGNHDWKSFYESMTEDPPIDPIVKLYFGMEGHTKFLLTGRPEKYRRHTLIWLYNLDKFYTTHGIDGIAAKCSLHMRKDGDLRPDYIIKEEMLMEFKSQGIWPDLVIDDRQDVVDMWRRHNIVCLQNSMKELQEIK